MRTLATISFGIWAGLVAPTTAQEPQNPRDLQAKIFELEQEKQNLQREKQALQAENNALSGQLKDAVRRCAELQKDRVARPGQPGEMVRQYVAERDRAVSDLKQLRESFDAERAKLVERHGAIVKSYEELRKQLATVETQKASAYRFASCSYQFVKGMLAAQNPVMRCWAAEKLGALGPDMKPAGGLLVEATKDQDPQVQQAAKAALKKIDPELAAKMGVE